jgi:DNA gyrase/topoisomerase IV subunit A
VINHASGVAALAKHRAEVSAAKHLHVLGALETVASSGDLITVAAVARQAQVSREFIYSHDDLKLAIHNARERATHHIPDLTTPSGREKSLLAERKTLLRRIEREASTIEAMTDQIGEFERQRQVWLGSQLAALTDAPAQELRVENERLNQRVIELSKQINSLEPVVAGLREELRISRIAHAEALREVDARHDNITYLQPKTE